MPSNHLLIIEDDPALLRGLKDNFEAQGYRVRTASDGRTGLDAALADPPELILLDIMLPKVNGFELCRQVRQHELDMPIIMLTAKGQEEDIIRGLELGADDYVTKPFSIRQLMARVSALLRRRQSGEVEVHRFGECELDLVSHRLLKQGVEVALTPKEFRMLAYFVKRPGRALTRSDIMDAVWGSSVIVTARSVDRCVTTLRNKIEPDPQRPTYVQTIRDIGYRFEVPETSQEPKHDGAGRADDGKDHPRADEIDHGARGHEISKRELEHAREIQMGLLPNNPAVEGLDIAIGFDPCRWIGGDYVDVVRAADRRIVLVIADVCGKGLPAALIASKLHGMVHASLDAGRGLAHMMQELNEHLCDYLDDNAFVTMAAVAIDPVHYGVECLNAGHLPPLIIEPTGKVHRLQHAQSLPLGVARQPMTSQQTAINRGDMLAMFTDGLTELTDAEGKMLGQDRLSEHLTRTHIDEPNKPMAEVRDELKKFLDHTRADHRSMDDRTFLLAQPV